MTGRRTRAAVVELLALALLLPVLVAGPASAAPAPGPVTGSWSAGTRASRWSRPRSCGCSTQRVVGSTSARRPRSHPGRFRSTRPTGVHGRPRGRLAGAHDRPADAALPRGLGGLHAGEPVDGPRCGRHADDRPPELAASAGNVRVRHPLRGGGRPADRRPERAPHARGGLGPGLHLRPRPARLDRRLDDHRRPPVGSARAAGRVRERVEPDALARAAGRRAPRGRAVGAADRRLVDLAHDHGRRRPRGRGPGRRHALHRRVTCRRRPRRGRGHGARRALPDRGRDPAARPPTSPASSAAGPAASTSTPTRPGPTSTRSPCTRAC